MILQNARRMIRRRFDLETLLRKVDRQSAAAFKGFIRDPDRTQWLVSCAHHNKARTFRDARGIGIRALLRDCGPHDLGFHGLNIVPIAGRHHRQRGHHPPAPGEEKEVTNWAAEVDAAEESASKSSVYQNSFFDYLPVFLSNKLKLHKEVKVKKTINIEVESAMVDQNTLDFEMYLSRKNRRLLFLI